MTYLAGRIPAARPGRVARTVLLAAAAALPAQLVAQAGDTAGARTDAAAERSLRVRPVLAGAAFGAAAALAAINPTGPSALDDESLFALGLATGIAFGVLGQRPGAELAFSSGWGVVRVGRLRDQLASEGDRRRPMGPQAWETRLSMLFPATQRWSLGPVLGVVSHGFKQVEQETRCGGFFGCISGDFVTSYSNVQALNAGMLARFTRSRNARFFGTFGAGLGPVQLDSNLGDGSAVLPYLEAGAGAARPGRLLRALEAGARLQAGEVGPTHVDMTGLFLRLQIALGPRP